MNAPQFRRRRVTIYMLMLLTAIILTVIHDFLGPYWSYIVMYGLTVGIIGLGFNLLLGYNGLLSFGHAGLFGIGMYTVGLSIRYFNIDSLELLILLAIVVGFLIASILGYIASRLILVYFALFMLAFGQIIFTLVYKLYNITLGSDGLPITVTKIFNISFSSRAEFLYYYYYFVIIVFILCTLFMWILVNSHFGKTIQAIKFDDIRVTYIGIPVHKYRYIAFLISALYATIAGAIYAPLAGHITPDNVSFVFSGEIVYLTLLGGMNSFSGPIVGAFVYTLIKVYLSTITEYWQFVMGATLIVIVLLFPNGIMGLVGLASSKFRKR